VPSPAASTVPPTNPAIISSTRKSCVWLSYMVIVSVAEREPLPVAVRDGELGIDADCDAATVGVPVAVAVRNGVGDGVRARD
jgi:hypothetical protein